MSDHPDYKSDSSQHLIYQIRIEGHLGQQWIDWFDGLSITLEEDGDTLLTGPVIDQAALHGLLKKVRDLGMPLVSIRQVQINETHPDRSEKGEKMNTINKATEKEDVKKNVKMKLSALWATLMFLYIYADIISLYKPGQIEKMISGQMGPFPATQSSLLVASILMMIPAVMIFLSITLKPKANRWANIIAGVLFTLVNIGNLIGVTWAYYIFFGIVEIVLTLMIIGNAWKWRNPEE